MYEVLSTSWNSSNIASKYAEYAHSFMDFSIRLSSTCSLAFKVASQRENLKIFLPLRFYLCEINSLANLRASETNSQLISRKIWAARNLFWDTLCARKKSFEFFLLWRLGKRKNACTFTENLEQNAFFFTSKFWSKQSFENGKNVCLWFNPNYVPKLFYCCLYDLVGKFLQIVFQVYMALKSAMRRVCSL